MLSGSVSESFRFSYFYDKPDFPKEDVARVMCDALTGTNTKNLKEIHIVDDTDEMLLLITKEIEQAIREKAKSGSLQLDRLPADVVSSMVQQSRTGALKPFLVHDGVKIFMRDSPIGNIKADAFVCPNDENLSGSTGAAKAVSDFVGNQYTQGCKQALDKAKKLKPGDILSVNTERIGLIINAITPQYPSSSAPTTHEDDRLYEQVLGKALENAFKAANEHNVSSLAVLPVGE